MTDVLSDVLAVTRLKGTVYFSAELRAPWGIALPQRPRSPFYMATRGRCEQFVERYPMDGHGHLEALEGTGPRTSLIGGFFELERAPEPLVAILPPVIHLSGADAEVKRWLGPILRAIAHEAAQAFPGRAVVLNRLADVLFVRTVRASLLKMSAANGTGPQSWLRGLTDPRIARALAEIHRAPEQAWSLGELASGAAMSRTAFAQRFRALVGKTPVSYLTAWRMQKAAYFLEMGTLSIAEIAPRVGYASELAFAKAFRRLIGMPPGAYARQHVKR